jgi:quinone-modifying oxidoreductase subunit QmoA
MASLKQSRYLREQYEDSTAEVFYIDMRTPGRYEKFLEDVKADAGITLTKGKVAKATEVGGGDVEVEVEDVLSGKKLKKRFDMVVLATGMQPSGADARVPGVTYTEEGFALSGNGVIAAGTGKSPLDVQRSVQSATAAALKGIQSLVRR